MRVALIANPGSGGGLEPEALAARLAAEGAEVRPHAFADRDRAAADSVDRVVVAGGDGSIGPCAELAGRLGVPLAVIPAGTANDFVRAHGLPVELGAAVRLAALGERTRALELGRLDGRPFVNVVSAGLSPAAALHARRLKRVLGPIAYGWGAVRAGLTAHPIDAAVRVDGSVLYSGATWQIIVAVSGAFGGGSSVDEADPGDGLLHVTVVPAGSRLRLARRAAGMRRGDLAGQAGVYDGEGVEIELGLASGTDVNLDGELCGPGRVTVEPAAFALVVG